MEERPRPAPACTAPAAGRSPAQAPPASGRHRNGSNNRPSDTSWQLCPQQGGRPPPEPRRHFRAGANSQLHLSVPALRSLGIPTQTPARRSPSGMLWGSQAPPWAGGGPPRRAGQESPSHLFPTPTFRPSPRTHPPSRPRLPSDLAAPILRAPYQPSSVKS